MSLTYHRLLSRKIFSKNKYFFNNCDIEPKKQKKLDIKEYSKNGIDKIQWQTYV